MYGELAYGEIGVGAWLNEQPIRVSGIDTIENAALSTGNLKSLATGPRWPAFGRLVGRLSRIRGYGDFLHYHLLASGRIDAVVESDVNILDVGACAVDRRSRGRQLHRSRGPAAHDRRAQRARDAMASCTDRSRRDRRLRPDSRQRSDREGTDHVDKKIIAVVGATGAQGGGLVRVDPGGSKSGEFAVRAITRDSDSPAARALAAAGAEVVAADIVRSRQPWRVRSKAPMARIA